MRVYVETTNCDPVVEELCTSPIHDAIMTLLSCGPNKVHLEFPDGSESTFTRVDEQ